MSKTGYNPCNKPSKLHILDRSIYQPSENVNWAKKLLDQLREELRLKHYSYRTEQAYVDWVRRFILFLNKRHPAEMGATEIRAFLTYLTQDRNVSASTQNRALSAILFLYRHVLHKEIEPVLLSTVKRPERFPIVLTRQEVLTLLEHLSGTFKLIAQLLYGSGLRLMECVRLRVKDVDFEYKAITVRDGKGEKDRIVPIPETIIPALRLQIERVRLIHAEDLAAGCGEVNLPNALAVKFPNASRELGWQYLLPASRLAIDPRSGRKLRHHIDPSALQRAVRQAAQKAGFQKRVSCHTLRHSFAIYLLQFG